MSEILLHVSHDFDAARSEIESYKGRVLHRLSADVIVAALPAHFDVGRLTKSIPVSDETRLAAVSDGVAGMRRAMQANSAVAATRLADTADESTRAAIAAWHYRTVEGNKVSPTEGHAWDHPGYQAP